MSAIYKIKIASKKLTLREQYVQWLQNAVKTGRPIEEARIDYAWAVARRVARLLRDQYGATRVRVFGSLLRPEQFDATSDIDLAVEGLTSSDYWRAAAKILFIDEQIIVDLVDQNTCPAAVWAHVEQEGVDL